MNHTEVKIGEVHEARLGNGSWVKVRVRDVFEGSTGGLASVQLCGCNANTNARDSKPFGVLIDNELRPVA